MPQRYVRVKTIEGKTYYGLLLLSRSVDVLDAPPWLKGKSTARQLEPDTYELLAPCTPSKIIAVGRNYRPHAEEMGTSVPKEPLLFFKPSTSITADSQPIYYPPQSHRIDYEGELAVIVGEPCTNSTPEQARTKIWGYTIANDVTARDLQKKDIQWTRAKGFDSFCPLGPWIVRELSTAARLQTFLNEESEPPPVGIIIGDGVFSRVFAVLYFSSNDTFTRRRNFNGDTSRSGSDAKWRSRPRGNRRNWSFRKSRSYSGLAKKNKQLSPSYTNYLKPNELENKLPQR